MKHGLGMMAFVLAAGFAGACGDDDADDIVVDERVAVIDVNNDQIIEANELSAAFAVTDINGDGVITVSEFQFNAAGFASLDVNGDGVITIDEWNAALVTWDANGDRVLEVGEFDPFL
jgi:Ca2+-binding EF-hand superfamily protein